MRNHKRGNGEGSIYQLPDGRWRAAASDGYRNGKPVRKVFTAATRGEVKDKLTKALRDQQQGIPLAPERATLGGFLQAWLKDVAKPGVRPKTYRTYDDLVRLHIVPALGKKPLAKLTPAHVRAFLNDKLTTPQPSRKKPKEGQQPEPGAPLSARTVKHILVTLRGALDTATKDGLVPRNVAALVDPPRLARKETQAFTPEQALKYIEEAKSDRLETLFTAAVAIGLRQGEILGLQWKDVDLEAGRLAVRHALQRVNKTLTLVEPKSTTSRRTITLPRVLVSALCAHRTRQDAERQWAGTDWRETDHVFTSTIGTPLDARNVIRRHRAILKAAGLPPLRFHDLRHSAATLLLAQGVSPRYISDLLGHSQVSFTMQTYAHVLPHVQREVADKMDAILNPPKNGVATTVATKQDSEQIN
ncbi:MAG TPA: site-specific integrase [Bryobacteraceae bacterium]|nr:site-specific integrase [Bryobacteraceae bacterium]